MKSGTPLAAYSFASVIKENDSLEKQRKKCYIIKCILIIFFL